MRIQSLIKIASIFLKFSQSV
uniref:Uncharacterized protein n=1 Tax=Rhizophora mucronata TaxID=61149 RepID=A0A2P2PDC5_RHIMU